jgi:hypothetical protein
MPVRAFMDISCVKSSRATYSGPGEALRRPGFHATNRGSNVGITLAMHAACSGDSESIIAPDLLGDRVARSYSES